MATLLAQVTVKPGMEEHWETIARRVYHATHEAEPGCRRYEYWRATAPRTYFVLLSFDDFDAFMEHQVADYHHDAGFGDCFESFHIQWVDPVASASPLPPSTTTGSEQPTRGERWNRYVRNHRQDRPEWWDRLRG